MVMYGKFHRGHGVLYVQRLDNQFHFGVLLQAFVDLFARIHLLQPRHQQHEARRRDEDGNAGLGAMGLACVSLLVHGLSFSDAES